MISVSEAERSTNLKLMTIPVEASIADSLLVSANQATILAVTAAMQRLAVATKVCSDLRSGRKEIKSRKFDAVLVDFDLGEQAPGLLAEVRKSLSNSTVPTIAITRNSSECSLAHAAGTNFIIEKPLNPEVLNHTLGASYGLVLRERRRYFRCRVKTRVSIRRSGMRETQCSLANISEGGMNISSAPKQLMSGMGVHVQFVLPGFHNPLTAVCEVRWRNSKNRAGLKFVLMPLEQRCDLQEWLARRLEQSMPESVAQRFRDSNERPRYLTQQ